MNYVPKKIPLGKLMLDPLNPRFVNIPNADQESIKDYLVDYEDVITIAKGIIEDGDLMPGERIIAVKEHNYYIVLEGNRRVCACKLIHGLLTTKKTLPSPEEETKQNIKTINVDLVESREAVQYALYRRHIKSIKGWPTQAKLFFFARRFLQGESISKIRKDTPDTTPSQIKDYIQKYNLLQRTLNVSNWTDAEKDSIDRTELEVDKFFRVFSSISDKYKKNAKDLLQLSYDETTLTPQSKLSDSQLNEGLYILAKAAFITDDLSTRKHVEHVKEFEIFLNSIDEEDENPTVPKDPTDPGPLDPPTPVTPPTTEDPLSPSPSPPVVPVSPVPVPAPPAPSPPTPTLSKPTFFSALTWTAIDPLIIDELGVANLAKEIQKLSESMPGRKEAFYERFPFATSIIMRSLFEQSLKFYIKKMKRWDDLIAYLEKEMAGKSKCKTCGAERNVNINVATFDPSLGQLAAFIRSNNNVKSLFPERRHQTAYGNAIQYKDYLDALVHTPEMFTPLKVKLDQIAADGMLSLITYILNEKKHWATN